MKYGESGKGRPAYKAYIAVRVLKQLAREPMSVLPAFGILIGSA